MHVYNKLTAVGIRDTLPLYLQMGQLYLEKWIHVQMKTRCEDWIHQTIWRSKIDSSLLQRHKTSRRTCKNHNLSTHRPSCAIFPHSK